MRLSLSPLESWFKKVLYQGEHAPVCHQHNGPRRGSHSENFILRACALWGSGWVTLGKELHLSELQFFHLIHGGSASPPSAEVVSREKEVCKVLSEVAGPEGWP